MYMTFEAEVTSVAQAKKIIAEIQQEFGDNHDVTIKLVAGDKSRVLKTLDESIKKTAAEIAAKLRREKE